MFEITMSAGTSCPSTTTPVALPSSTLIESTFELREIWPPLASTTRASASVTPPQPPMGTPGVPRFRMFFMMVTTSEAGVFAAVVDSDQPQALSASRRISGSCKAMSAPVPFFWPISLSKDMGALACAAGDSSSLKLMNETCLLSRVIQVPEGSDLTICTCAPTWRRSPARGPVGPCGIMWKAPVES